MKEIAIEESNGKKKNVKRPCGTKKLNFFCLIHHQTDNSRMMCFRADHGSKIEFERERRSIEKNKHDKMEKRKENETFTGPECVLCAAAAAAILLRLRPIDVNWKQSLFDEHTRIICLFELKVLPLNGPPILLVDV